MKQAALPRSIANQVLARDKGCVFTGVSSPPTSDSEKLEVTWIFPPFLGYTVSTTFNCTIQIQLALMLSWRSRYLVTNG